MKKILLLSLAASLLWGCSRAEPRIVYGFIDLIYYPGREGPEERYAFFALSEDDDGIENLSELYLYHDREGLRWLLTSEDWIQFDQDERTWIGSRNIAMFADGPLPRGQYRAVLVNKGGERTESRFTFDGPEEAPHPVPTFTVNEGMYSIISEYPVNQLLCYDQQGNYIQTLRINDLEGFVSELRLSSSVRTGALWAENPEYRISVVTEAVALR